MVQAGEKPRLMSSNAKKTQSSKFKVQNKLKRTSSNAPHLNNRPSQELFGRAAA